MRYISLITLLGALAAAPVLAQDDQVLRGPVPEWVQPSELLPVPDDTSGLVFVRRQDTLVHLGQDGEAQYFGYRMKILHANALELGNLSLVWDPDSGPPTVHAIRIYRADQTIDALEGASFEILRREEQLEAAQLDGRLTAVLRIADLRVGDELEVEVTTPFRDPTLGDKSAGILALAPEPQPGRIRLGVYWDEGQEPNFQMTSYMTGFAQRGERSLTFQFDNPGALSPPKDAPARYQWQRTAEYSDFEHWAAISSRFAPLYAEAARIPDGSPLKEEARRIASAYSSPMERAKAALELVQKDVRYIYLGLNGANLMPATAEETWRRRYGDCKGKTVLLLALLAEMGIEAQPVLVSNGGMDDGLDERLPNPGMFDHVLVRARIGGVQYWLDGTLPPVVPPQEDPVMSYRWVLPLTDAGASLEAQPWHPAARPDDITMYEIDARAGFDEPATITSTEILRGLRGLQQQAAFSSLTPAQLLNNVRQNMTGDTWQAIDAVEWRYDEDAQASIFTISGTGTVDWDDNGDGWRLALPGGGFGPPNRRIRPADQDQQIPFANDPEFDCRVTTVRLPEATQDGNWSYGRGYDTTLFGQNYYRAFELRDGTIRMVRGLRVNEREIDPATALQDNERIADFDNSMAWIYYDPDRAELPADQASVPATYEIDWMADSAACLAPGADNRGDGA